MRLATLTVLSLSKRTSMTQDDEAMSVFTHSGPFSAGHGHEACWSNSMQMPSQVECKRVDNSVQLPTVTKPQPGKAVH
jgi:hypothetical protein